MTVIDADAHINENAHEWKGLFEKRPGWATLGESAGKPVWLIDSKLYPRQDGPGCGVPIDTAILPAAMEGAFNLDARIRDMDAEGIDVQVLFGGLSIGITSYTDPGFALDFAQAYNNWLLDEQCARFPDRLKGVATLPLQDVQRSIGELQRVAGKACAVTIPPVVGSLNLDDPSLIPFFEAAADVGLPIGVHNAPGMNLPLPAAERFSNYAQVHLLSFPVDQMVAFTALALGGVLDRFPRLKFAFLEAGVGWVPYFVDRAHEHREKRGELLPDMKSDPEEFIARGQCYFSFECEDRYVPHFIERFGSDALVFASDYPHWDADFPGTVTEARELVEPLGADVADKLLAGNAARLYNL